MAEKVAIESPNLRALLEKLHRESFGWALSCCNHDQRQAEEVLQSVYLKILEGKARFNGTATFKTWLFSVIRKTAADERRRDALRRLRLSKYKESDAELASEEDAHTRWELENLFQRALDTLSKRQQQMLDLVFYHDLTIAEAAQVMNISLGSARTHYERGKKRLREWMEENNVANELQLERSSDERVFPAPQAGR